MGVSEKSGGASVVVNVGAKGVKETTKEIKELEDTIKAANEGFDNIFNVETANKFGTVYKQTGKEIDNLVTKMLELADVEKKQAALYEKNAKLSKIGIDSFKGEKDLLGFNYGKNGKRLNNIGGINEESVFKLFNNLGIKKDKSGAKPELSEEQKNAIIHWITSRGSVSNKDFQNVLKHYKLSNEDIAPTVKGGRTLYYTGEVADAVRRYKSGVDENKLAHVESAFKLAKYSQDDIKKIENFEFNGQNYNGEYLSKLYDYYFNNNLQITDTKADVFDKKIESNNNFMNVLSNLKERIGEDSKRINEVIELLGYSEKSVINQFGLRVGEDGKTIDFKQQQTTKEDLSNFIDKNIEKDDNGNFEINQRTKDLIGLYFSRKIQNIDTELENVISEKFGKNVTISNFDVMKNVKDSNYMLMKNEKDTSDTAHLYGRYRASYNDNVFNNSFRSFKNNGNEVKDLEKDLLDLINFVKTPVQNAATTARNQSKKTETKKDETSSADKGNKSKSEGSSGGNGEGKGRSLGSRTSENTEQLLNTLKDLSTAITTFNENNKQNLENKAIDNKSEETAKTEDIYKVDVVKIGGQDASTPLHTKFSEDDLNLLSNLLTEKTNNENNDNLADKYNILNDILSGINNLNSEEKVFQTNINGLNQGSGKLDVSVTNFSDLKIDISPIADVLKEYVNEIKTTNEETQKTATDSILKFNEEVIKSGIEETKEKNRHNEANRSARNEKLRINTDAETQRYVSDNKYLEVQEKTNLENVKQQGKIAEIEAKRIADDIKHQNKLVELQTKEAYKIAGEERKAARAEEKRYQKELERQALVEAKRNEKYIEPIDKRARRGKEYEYLENNFSAYSNKSDKYTNDFDNFKKLYNDLITSDGQLNKADYTELVQKYNTFALAVKTDLKEIEAAGETLISETEKESAQRHATVEKIIAKEKSLSEDGYLGSEAYKELLELNEEIQNANSVTKNTINKFQSLIVKITKEQEDAQKRINADSKEDKQNAPYFEKESSKEKRATDYVKVLNKFGEIENGKLSENPFVDTESGNEAYNAVVKLQDAYDKLTNSGGVNKETFDKLKDTYEALLIQVKNINPELLKESDSFVTLGAQLKDGDISTIKDAISGTLDKTKELKSLSEDGKGVYTAIFKNDDGTIESLKYKLIEFNDAAGNTVRLIKQFKDSGKSISVFGALGDVFKDIGSYAKRFMTTYALIAQARRFIGNAVNYTMELDKALTTINQTMDTSDSELKNLGKSANAVARELGTSATSVLSAAQIYANANETAQSILEKSRATILLSNASGADVSTVANQIQGVIEQFENLSGQEQRIVNSYEKISAGIAVDFQQGINSISEAVGVAGSIASQSGLEFEQYAASIAKVIERTRQSGSTIGNAYKSIMARVSRSKTADESVSDADRSKASKALASVGISVYDKNGQYKDLSDTLNELSGVWNTLTDAQKNYIAEQAAGVRGINTFNALISTWSEAQTLANSALSDTNFYLVNQDKYMDSIAGKMAVLKAEIQEIYAHLVESDLIKAFLDLFKSLLSLIDGFLAGVDKLLSFTDSSSVKIGTLVALLSGLLISIKLLKQVGISKVFFQFNEAGTAIEAFKFSASGLSEVLGILKGSLMSLLSTAAVIGVITGIIVAISNYESHHDKLEKKLSKQRNTYSELTTEIDSLKNKYKELNNEIANYNKNLNLSPAETLHLNELQEESDLLEAQIDMYDRKAEIEARKLASSANKLYEEDYQQLSEGDFEYNDKGDIIGVKEGVIPDNGIEGLVEEYNKLDENLKNSTTSSKEFEKAQEDLQKSEEGLVNKQDELITYLNDMQAYYDIIKEKENNEIDLTASDKHLKQQYEEILSYVNLIDKTLDPQGYRKSILNKLFSDSDFADLKYKFIDLAKTGQLDSLDLSKYEGLEEKLKSIGFAVDNLDEFKLAIQEVADAFDPIKDAMEGIGVFGDSANIFDDMVDGLADAGGGLKDLADMVEALGSNFTLTAVEARKFGAIFPELLAQGKVTSDGLIQFTSDQVNAFKQAKETELRMDAQSRIDELEAGLKQLEAEREIIVAKLEMVQKLKTGEISLEQVKNNLIADANKNLSQYLIDLGVDEAQAKALQLTAESENWDEYDKIVSGFASQEAQNFANAHKDMATNSYNNVSAMIQNMDQYRYAARAAAVQTAGVGEGKVTDSNGSYNKNLMSGTTTGGISIQDSFDKLGGPDDSYAEWYANKYKVKIKDGNASWSDNLTGDTIETTYKGITTNSFNSDILSSWEEYYNGQLLDIDSSIENAKSQINLLKAGMLSSLDTFKSKNKSGGSGKKDSDTKETIDWLAIAIDRLESKISQLGKTAGNVYKVWGERSNALKGQIEATTQELALQSVAYGAYMDAADKVDLSEDYKKLVRDGAIDIETITDKDLKKKIDEYKGLYENAQKSLEKSQDLEQELGNLYKQEFNNVSTIADIALKKIENTITAVEKGIELVQAKGGLVGDKYYKKMIKQEENNILELTKKYENMAATMQEEIDSGALAVGSEEYENQAAAMQEVAEAIKEGEISLQGYINQMRENDWANFEKKLEHISYLLTESNFLIDGLSSKEDDLFNDNGDLSAKGLSVAGLRAVNYDTYMAEAQQYANKIKELDKELAEDPNNINLIEKKQEYIEAQQEAIQNAKAEKDAVIDLMSSAYDKMLEVLQEIIDKRKEALQEEKNQYDYQKKVAKQTSDINKLERQILALSGDDSEETRTKLQSLNEKLSEARDELEETEYDKYLEDQEALLDSISDEMQELINARLDDIDALFEQTIADINSNASLISETIKEYSDSVGYTLSDSMEKLWQDGGYGKEVVGYYVGEIKNILGDTQDETTLLGAITSIMNKVQEIIDMAEDEVDENTKEEPDTTDVKVPKSSSDDNNKKKKKKKKEEEKKEPTKEKKDEDNKKGSFFITKYDEYPKSKLNIVESIVDRLKYHDYDSSMSARAKYYSGMGLGKESDYKSTASQNIAMLNWINNIVQVKNLKLRGIP